MKSTASTSMLKPRTLSLGSRYRKVPHLAACDAVTSPGSVGLPGLIDSPGMARYLVEIVDPEIPGKRTAQDHSSGSTWYEVSDQFHLKDGRLVRVVMVDDEVAEPFDQKLVVTVIEE